MSWWLNTRDASGLLWAFLEYCDEVGSVSFEGNLQSLGLMDLPNACTMETAVLKRMTRDPVLDFVVLPINRELIRALKQLSALPGALNDGPVIHVQIEHSGMLALGAYDNFHRDCVVAADPVPEELLEHLVAVGILRSFDPTLDD